MLAIVTSSWFTKLPDTYARIGISRGTPRGQSGYRMYRALAPGSWYRSVDEGEYRSRYDTLLQLLDPRKVIADLEELAEGRSIALLCFERPPPDSHWCHRGLVSAWFADELGLAVPEFDHEAAGTGWLHPKLPPSMRVAH